MRRAHLLVILVIVSAFLLGLLAEADAGRYARLCQLALGFVALCAIATSLRGRLRDGAVIVCSLVFGLTLLEGGQIAFGKPIPFTTDEGISKTRPIVGWGPVKPGIFRTRSTDGKGNVVYDVHVTIDDTLNRKVDTAKGPGAFAFFGDSAMFGEGLDDAGTLPQAFADLLGRKYPVVDLAFSGWSPAQNLAALQAGFYDALLQSPRRFILLTASFHAERTACLADFSARAPRFVPDGDTVKREGYCRTPFQIAVRNVLGNFSLYRNLSRARTTLSRGDVEMYIKVVKAFVKTAEDRYHVGTTILFLPFDPDYLKATGYTEAEIVAAFKAAGADVLYDGLPRHPPPGDLIIPGDGHPTALANRLRAEALLDLLKRDDPKAFGPLQDLQSKR